MHDIIKTTITVTIITIVFANIIKTMQSTISKFKIIPSITFIDNR